MRKLNPVFLVGLVCLLSVLGAGIYFVHSYQVRRNASGLLDRARRAEAENNLAAAEESLSRYLQIQRSDGPTWAWYARVVDQRAPKSRGLQQIYLVHEQALRYNPGDSQLERRCVESGIGAGTVQRRPAAHRKPVPASSRGFRGPAGRLRSLEDLLGQCYRGESNFGQAEEQFRKAISHDPARVASYDRLARLLRTDLRQTEAADRLIEQMVEANSNSARAYLSRWQYQSDFLPPGDAQCPAALELDPDDPDVLLAAAGVSEQKGELNAARSYLHKAIELVPTNTSVHLTLARLEIRDGHLDARGGGAARAAAANPSADVDFVSGRYAHQPGQD